jgi:hypothetical protein
MRNGEITVIGVSKAAKLGPMETEGWFWLEAEWGALGTGPCFRDPMGFSFVLSSSPGNS